MRSSPEFELIERVREALRAAGAETDGLTHGIGDDAAVSPARGVTVTSVDLFVEGVHFGPAFQDEQIGEKALGAALSDLAAMGAEAREAYVGFVAPAGFADDRAIAIATGIGRVAAAHGVAVLGGDISAGRELVLAMTVIGEAGSAGALAGRSGALPGERVLVSGSLGAAAAGLLILTEPELAAGLEPELAQALRARQLTPRPLLGLGAALARGGATAMVDVSDGVVADAEQIASESGVRIELDAERLPLAGGVEEVARAAGRHPLALAGGGEDYELLVTAPPASVSELQAAAKELGERLSEIGRVEDGSGVGLSGADAGLARGFDHLGR